jgi:hypothetical protein
MADAKEAGYAAVRALGILSKSDALFNALVWSAVDAAVKATAEAAHDEGFRARDPRRWVGADRNPYRGGAE